MAYSKLLGFCGVFKVIRVLWRSVIFSSELEPCRILRARSSAFSISSIKMFGALLVEVNSIIAYVASDRFLLVALSM